MSADVAPDRRCSGRARSAGLSRPGRRARRRDRRRRRAAGRRSPASCAAARATSSGSSRTREIVVELIGGTEPARDYVLRALRAGRHVVTANKQLIAQHGDELFDGGPRGGRAASLRGRGRGRGAGDPGDPGEPRATEIDEGLRDRQRDHELHPHRDGQHRRLLRGRPARAPRSSATRRPIRPTTSSGADAAAKMAILARLAFDAPVALADVSFEGITEIQPDDIAYAKELGPVAEAARGRRAARRRDQRPGLPLLPLPRPSPGPGRGPVQRGDGRGAGDHRDHDVGPGRGRRRDRLGGARRRRLDPLRRAPVHAAASQLEIVRDDQLLVLPPPRGRRPPRRARADRGRARAQRGLGAKRRPARAWATTRGW